MSGILDRLAAREYGKRRRITLLRHGSVSYFDDAGRPVGTDMVPLNELGRVQAKAAGDLLKDSRFDRVIVSGLPRTIETAELVLQHNHHDSPAYETWAELREIRGNRMQDLKDEDIEPGFLQVFAAPADLERRFLGGESLAEFGNRIWPAFARLLADPDWTHALLVLHGGTNRAILSYCLAGGRDGRCDRFLGGLHQTPACINLIDVGDAQAGDIVVRAQNIAALDLMQTKTRKTTLEELLEKYLKFRRGR
jgi:broad specificity phosphatase PhoE